MENFKSSKFTAKDVFNSMSATPIKDAESKTLKVEAVAIKDKADGTPCGLIKTVEGKIYGTISATVLEQLVPLAEVVEAGPVDIKVTPKVSGQGRTYYVLEMVSNI